MNPETGEVIHCAKYWGKSPLHKAVLDDNPKHCEELILEGEDVNIVYCGMTPLHLACKVGHRTMVETLIRLKSDVNAGTIMEGCTPLHVSSTLGRQDLTDVLLQNGADINKVTEKGVTPLWLASQNGHVAAAHRLIQQGMDVNKANNDGVSPLAVAVCNGSTEVAQALVDAHCKIDQADKSGCTPLYHAVQAGQRDISRLLVEAGATVNQSTNNGDYPIHLAALYGNINILDTLIKQGADVTVMTPRGTPVYSAVQRQHVNAVRRLIEAGAFLDMVFTRTDTSVTSTPFIDAVCHRCPNLDLICTLIQGGCNVDAGVAGKVPLEFALRHGHIHVSHLLLLADCNPFLSNVRPVVANEKLQPATYQLLQMMFTPKSLLAVCRSTLRASLGYGHCYVEKIDKLNLPRTLKMFLSYAEVSPDSCLSALNNVKVEHQ